MEWVFEQGRTAHFWRPISPIDRLIYQPERPPFLNPDAAAVGNPFLSRPTAAVFPWRVFARRCWGLALSKGHPTTRYGAGFLGTPPTVRCRGPRDFFDDTPTVTRMPPPDG